MSDVHVRVENQELLLAFKAAPKVFNQEANRALRSIGGAFGKHFMSRTGVKVRRKATVKKQDKKHPRLPDKMRLLGFKAIIYSTRSFKGGRKTMEVRSRNPVVIKHEEGGTIGPKKGSWLYLKVRDEAMARRLGVKLRTKNGRSITRMKVRNVTLRRTLRFDESWQAFDPSRWLETMMRRSNDRLARGQYGSASQD